jgi:hypothetical protein
MVEDPLIDFEEVVVFHRHAVPRVEPDGPRGYLEKVLSVYGPLVSSAVPTPDGD